MSISDELMIRYYELLSHISIDELNSLKEGMKTGSVHPMEAKKTLSMEIVERYYDAETAKSAREEFENIFKKKGLPDDVPVFKLENGEDIWIPGIMKEAGLAGSTGEGIRLIKQGGVSVDGEKLSDPNKKIPAKECFLKVGKRKFLKISV
jgi:tyrosyl-tRNA synthetase